jgi:hypothetical protein
MEYFCNFLQWWTNKNFSVDPVCTVECTYKLISCVVGESQYETCTEESSTVYSNSDIFVMRFRKTLSLLCLIFMSYENVFFNVSRNFYSKTN